MADKNNPRSCIDVIPNVRCIYAIFFGVLCLLTLLHSSVVSAQTAINDSAVVNYDVLGSVAVLSNDSASGGNTLDPDSVIFPLLGQPAGSTFGVVLSGDPTLTVPGEGTYTALPDGSITFEGLASFGGRATAITYEVFETPSGNSDTATLTLIINERGTCIPDNPSDPGVVIGTPGGTSPDIYVFPLDENPSGAEFVFNHNTLVVEQNSDGDATNNIPNPINGLDTDSLEIINSMGLDSVHNILFYASNSGGTSNRTVFYYAGDQPRSNAVNAPLGRIGVLISDVENITECAIPANCPNLITAVGRGLNDAAGEFFGGSYFLGAENSDGANLDRLYQLDIDANVFPPILESVTLVREFNFGNENSADTNHDWGDVVIDPSTLTMYDIDRGVGEANFEIHTLDMSTIPFTHTNSCNTGSADSTTGQAIMTHDNRLFMLTGNGAQFREILNPTTCALGPLSDISGAWPAGLAAADGSSCSDPNAFASRDRDLGDAPDSYSTLRGSVGPSHIVTSQFGRARYIRLMKAGGGANTGGDAINLAEVQVFDVDGINRALTGTGTASQNSTLGPRPASICNDGNTVGSDGGGTICHTAGATTNDWWQVDLGAEYNISEIRISNRDDCCQDRLSNMYIFGADTAFPANTVLGDSIANADFQAQLGAVSAASPDQRVVGTEILLNIGAIVDSEINGQPSTDATADNTTDTNDEDGVTFLSPGGGPHAEVYADVSVNNNTGADAYVCAWLDRWDNTGSGDGVFDLTDVQDSVAPGSTRCETVADGGGVVQFYWGGLEQVSGSTFFRVRLCDTDGECDSPGGTADSGEVEDYQLFFDFSPTAVTIGSVELESRSVDQFFEQLGFHDLSTEELISILFSWRSIEIDQSLIADTAAALEQLRDYLDPDGDSQVAILRWHTLEERGTIGFFVERKQSDGPWDRVNEKMLPALIVAPLGGEYILADPGAASGHRYSYRLIEQEATGTTQTYGPFELELP